MQQQSQDQTFQQSEQYDPDGMCWYEWPMFSDKS